MVSLERGVDASSLSEDNVLREERPKAKLRPPSSKRDDGESSVRLSVRSGKRDDRLSLRLSAASRRRRILTPSDLIDQAEEGDIISSSLARGRRRRACSA